MKHWLLKIAAALLLLVPQVVAGQWTNLGTQSLPLVMTGDYHGIRAAHSPVPSPLGASEWRFFGTNDDWVTLDWRGTGGASAAQCCVVERLHFRDEDHGFKVLNAPTGLQVHRTQDKGFTWSVLGFVQGIDMAPIADICSTSDTTAYVIGDENGVSGNAIVLLKTPLTQSVVFASTAHDGADGRVLFVNDSLGFVSARDTNGIYQLMRTTNGGQNWSVRLQVAIGAVRAIQFVTPQIGFVAGASGVFYKTTDAGFTWNSLAANGPVDIFDMDFLDEQTGYLACGAGLVLWTIDGGNIWFSDEIDSLNTFIYVKAISTDIAYVLGSDSVLYKRNYVVGEMEALDELREATLFPNPASDQVKIALPGGDRLRYWRMLDMNGRDVMTGNQSEWTVSGLPKGLYLVEVVTQKGALRKLLTVY